MKIYWQWEEREKEIIPSAAFVYTVKDEVKITNAFKEQTKINLTGIEFDIESIVKIHNAKDVLVKRKAVIEFLWGEDGFPKDIMPNSIEKGITDVDFDSLNNVQRIDKLTINMDFELNSIAYHFIPEHSNKNLVIYH